MKRLLLAVLLLSASDALAAGGGPTNPLYVREQQGTTRTYKEVSCTTAGDVALVTAAEAANARSILFQNADATNFAVLCPVAAATGVCDNVAEGLTLWNKGSLPINRSIRDGAWSCKGDTASVVVEVLIEQ